MSAPAAMGEISTLEDLEARLLPVLRHYGIAVEMLQAIGLLDRSERSAVFSLLINHKHHVLKLYFVHGNYVRDMRNYRRLLWPPKILLTSSFRDNPLRCDLLITEVPQGSSFTSADLRDGVRDRLSEHLIQLHRAHRSRRVSLAGLHRAVGDTEPGALRAASNLGGPTAESVAAIIHELHHFLDQQAQVMRVRPSLLHNDLWWDNIIIAGDDVYLIDWEWLKVGDYAEDLAYARIMLIFRPRHNPDRKFWVTPRDEDAADRFFAGLAEGHIKEFSDPTLFERFKFYMALQTLRRLSDYAAGTYGKNEELLEYWVEHLPRFWKHGLGR